MSTDESIDLSVREMEVNSEEVDMDSQDDIAQLTRTSDHNLQPNLQSTKKCNGRTRNRKRELNGNGLGILDSVTYTKYQSLLDAVYDYFGDCGLECNLCESRITQLRRHISEVHESRTNCDSVSESDNSYHDPHEESGCSTDDTSGLSTNACLSSVIPIPARAKDNSFSATASDTDVIQSQPTYVFRILDMVTYTKYQSLLDAVYDYFGDCGLECNLCESLIIQLRLHISDAHESRVVSESESDSEDSDPEPNEETNCSTDDGASGLSINESSVTPIPTPVHGNNLPAKASETEMTKNQPNQEIRNEHRATATATVAKKGRKRQKYSGVKAYKRKNLEFGGKGKYKCNNCSSYFITNGALSSHTRVHENAEQCGICEMIPDNEELTQHMMSTHKDVVDKPYTCMICNEKFTNALELDEHFVKIHPSTLPFPCKDCDKRFYSERVLASHSFVHTDETLYICEHCNKALKTPYNLESHVRTHTPEKPYKCRIETCDKSYNNKGQVQIHERSHGHMTSMTATKDNQISCGICTRTFSSSRALTTHLRMIHTDLLEQHDCRFCDKKFLSKILRSKHILQAHPGEKPFECPTCHKKFVDEQRFLVHVRTHTGEKPFQCSQCSDAFSSAKGLKNHIWVHTGKKPHQCDQCDKSFTTSGALTVHKRLHSGEKPFMCELCSKCFAGKKYLNQHMTFHKNDERVHVKPHPCQYCDKSFPTRVGLNLHSKIHIGDKSHICAACGKCFLLAHQLTAHLKTHNID